MTATVTRWALSRSARRRPVWRSATTDGLYWLDPDGDGADSVELYCDLTSDGGGWSLLSWTGNSTTLSGVPYPGLSICEKPPCSRGSSADDVLLTDLITQSIQIGIGHSPKALSSYQNLTDYDYSDYGSMKGFSLDTYSGTTVGCDVTGFASGTFGWGPGAPASTVPTAHRPPGPVRSGCGSWGTGVRN